MILAISELRRELERVSNLNLIHKLTVPYKSFGEAVTKLQRFVSIFYRVCKYRELAVKWKFRNSSYSVRKNSSVKRFRKSQSQSQYLKSFLFRENRQKVKCCPTPYSRRSKTFELYHFQSPREERRFKETSSSLAGK